MTLDELTPWLFERVSGGIRWGLGRTEELLAGVGDPHRRFHSVLIAGTNGKGSVAALCDAALRSEGAIRVGLYTSPHLVSLTERVRIQGVPVSAEVLAAAAERLRPAIESKGASFFEATTAISFLVFAEAGVELVVAEVGLGGRLDSTNVLEPLATAVTNVALDHTEYLGNSLAEIAVEKAGIFKRGVPALSGETEPQLQLVLRRVAEAVGAPYHEIEELATYEVAATGPWGVRISLDSGRWGDVPLTIPLPGSHQARNAAVAVELLGFLPQGLRPSRRAIVEGFAAVRWPGRLQIETIGGTTWLFDVAHNPAGAAALADAIPSLDLPQPIVLVAGILADKDWRRMLHPLYRMAPAVILTTPPSAPPGRRWDLEEAGAWSERTAGVTAKVIPDFDAALARATALAPHGTVVVAGSVHTVGDAMKVLGVRSY